MRGYEAKSAANIMGIQVKFFIVNQNGGKSLKCIFTKFEVSTSSFRMAVGHGTFKIRKRRTSTTYGTILT